MDAYPQLEKKLLELSPEFARLQNPVLRRTVARVTTLQQAARIAGISPVDLVQALRKAAGLTTDTVEDGAKKSADADADDDSRPRPEWFDESKISVRFDASPVIESGGSPMQEIMRLASGLKEGEILALTAPFKPVPILDLLHSKGFETWYAKGVSYITAR